MVVVHQIVQVAAAEAAMRQAEHEAAKQRELLERAKAQHEADLRNAAIARATAQTEIEAQQTGDSGP